MKREIEQPTHLELPDVNDPFSWALYARLNADWLRHIGPQLGMDMPKLMMGDALSDIIGDDYGAIAAWNVIIGHQENASMCMRMLLERMDWESDTPDLPLEIRTAILNTIENVKDLNLADEKEYYQVKNEWLTLRHFVQDIIAERPELQEALDYSLEQSEIWSSYWQAFLGMELG